MSYLLICLNLSFCSELRNFGDIITVCVLDIIVLHCSCDFKINRTKIYTIICATPPPVVYFSTKVFNVKTVKTNYCRVPDITVATDVICGFPTETAEVKFLKTFVPSTFNLNGINLKSNKCCSCDGCC